MEPLRFLRRKAASAYLYKTYGLDRAPSTLAKLAVIGGGPVFRRLNRVPLYSVDDLDEWVSSRLSGPMRSTSDWAPLACEVPGNGKQFDPSGTSDNGASRRRSSSPGPVTAASFAAQPATQARGGGS